VGGYKLGCREGYRCWGREVQGHQVAMLVSAEKSGAGARSAGDGMTKGGQCACGAIFTPWCKTCTDQIPQHCPMRGSAARRNLFLARSSSVSFTFVTSLLW